MSCHEAFTTYEAISLGFIRVQHQNAVTTAYSRAKLYSSVDQAFDGHQTTSTTIDAITDTIESKLLDLKSRSLTSTQISQTILTTLKHFDTAAFLRYLAKHAQLRNNAELKRQLKNF